MRFHHHTHPARVTFGRGCLASVPEEVDRLGLTRVLVLSTPGREHLARTVADALGSRCAALHPHAAQHVPAGVAERAVAAARAAGADGCLAIGGGSAIGLAKAVALDTGRPIVAVPTTYAGSEMTPVWGLTRDGVKVTGRDARVLPRAVVYDPDLTVALPVRTSVTSGINAIAHAVEALYAPDASPITALVAEEGARALYAALPEVAAGPGRPAARTGALYGAWLCGMCLGSSTMSLHHKLCHVLGGTLGLPHAETHTVVLPHVVAFNEPATSAATAALRRAWDTAAPARALHELAGRLGAPTSLRSLGVPRDALDVVVERVAADPYGNPRRVTPDDLRALLTAAYDGRPPRGGGRAIA